MPFDDAKDIQSEEVKGIHLRRSKMPSEDAKDALWEIKQIETICRTIYLS